LPRAHLLGDWFGLRTKAEDVGISPTVTFVSDVAGNVTGARIKVLLTRTISDWTCCSTSTSYLGSKEDRSWHPSPSDRGTACQRSTSETFSQSNRFMVGRLST